MRGPSAHFSRSDRPSTPRMSMASSAPVMASKPVAKTMLSSSYSASAVRRPCWRDRLDRHAPGIDQGHVVAVEGLVVAGVEAQALGADRVVAWREQLGDLRVVDDLADLGAHELGGGVVGLPVGGQVAERPHRSRSRRAPSAPRTPPGAPRAGPPAPTASIVPVTGAMKPDARLARLRRDTRRSAPSSAARLRDRAARCAPGG